MAGLAWRSPTCTLDSGLNDRLRTAAPKLHVDGSPRVKAQRWYFVECGGSTSAFNAPTPDLPDVQP
jgi:hypothetical protein